MRLLIITQKVDKNDSVLGFFHTWIEEFSKNCKEIIVICLEEGEHSLPSNVRVLSLGKEEGVSRLKYLKRFYKYIWQERNNYDAVFVHMNPEYVVLGGGLWHKWDKKVALWYTHREKDIKLKLATSIADVIFTASKEGFTHKSSKVLVVGHGINPDKFPVIPTDFTQAIRILHLGRITRIKNIDVILRAAKHLIDAQVSIAEVRMAGAPITSDDQVYKKELVALAKRLGITDLLNWDESGRDEGTFNTSTVSINAAPDGGMDKAVLGSLATEKPAFISNTAFLGVYGVYWEDFHYPYGDDKVLAVKIKRFIDLKHKDQIQMLIKLGSMTRAHYSVEKLVGTLSKTLSAEIDK